MGIISGLIFTGAVTVWFIVAAVKDWGGAAWPNEANDYCERIRPGRIKQPVNTFSNLGFIIAGLVMLAVLDGSTGASTTPMATTTSISVLFGIVVIWLGPGSMFLHASQKVWGGWLDNLSMNMFITFVVWYDLAQGNEWGAGWFWLAYLLSNIAIGALNWFVTWPKIGLLTFGLLIAAMVGVEIWAIATDRYDRDFLWIIPVVLSFGTAFFIWFKSRSGGPWCKPNSIWQGHGAWHLLSALATVFIFVYLRSEV